MSPAPSPRSRIARRLFAIVAVSVLCAVGPATLLESRRVAREIERVNEESLVARTRALARELEKAPPADRDAWLRSHAGVRVTLVGGDGRVIADSVIPPESIAAMDNHATRPEVAAALAGAVGRDVRTSITLGVRSAYFAVPVTQGEVRVLRLSLPVELVEADARRAQWGLVGVGLLALLPALLLAAWLARSLARPLVETTRFARALTAGQFDTPLPPTADDEVGDLVHALDTMRAQLAAQIDELRHEGHKLRTVLESMSEGVALVQGGAIAVANRAFSRLAGVKHDIVDRPLVDALRAPEVVALVERAQRETATPQRVEITLDQRQLEARAVAVGESAALVMLMLVDVTEARRLERTRRDFVANASHELRTPVAAILAAAQTLAQGAGDDERARASFLDILLRHAERLERLTADLLDIAKLEGGYRPQIERVRLQDITSSVLTLTAPFAAERNITVSAEVGDAVVAAERSAVERILANLIENAIKYSDQGARVRVVAEPDQNGKKVVITVSDQGRGIPAQHLPRLFERFYRADDGRAREAGGTGLGLAIVKHLVLAQGGDVRVESELGRGSRFLVTLPTP